MEAEALLGLAANEIKEQMKDVAQQAIKMGIVDGQRMQVCVCVCVCLYVCVYTFLLHAIETPAIF